MSIKSELNKTASLLQSTKKAIIGRGGNLTINAGFKDLPEAIFNIPSNDSLSFIEANTVSYVQCIPSDVGKNALINKVGGMSYKTVNLYNAVLEQGGINNLGELTNTTTRLRNVDYIVLSAGTYTLSFPQGFYAVVRTYSTDEEYVASESTTYSTDNLVTFTISTTRKIKFNFKKSADGAISPSDISEIMLNVGDTALPYEPYFEGLRDAKPTGLESRGANLLSFPFAEGDVDATVERQGITYTVNADRSVTAKGTASGSSFFILSRTLNLGDKMIGSSVNGGTNGSFSGSRYIGYNPNNGLTVISIASGLSIDETFYPMINRGTEAVPYKPFIAEPIDTLEIPEAVQNLLGYGVGKSLDECNYIDFGRKVFVNEYEVADGTVQRRENPIETDLTDMFPNIKQFLKVEGGVSITLHNEYGQAVPSKIKYIRKVGI